MKIKLLAAAVISTLAFSAQSADFLGADHNWNNGSSAAKTVKKAGKPVGIVKGTLEIAGISRNADNGNMVDPAFAKTSRPCPPFCIQPTAPFAPAAVETVTELDVIHAARDIAGGDTTQLVIDARTKGWAKKGMIPHAVNVPFTKLNSKALAKDPMAVVEILTDKFGVVDMDGVLNYDNAKTLYLYCNGSWCGQSPAAIRALLTMGYPQSKIKYYRGGMNDWKLLGLTVK
ncbi:rhodanese-like domain-containing protein [Candidatus Thioglobus sp.]|uniref:rhodanese-like domain-containing protein n=1 Tax=Candidatus Thioglobus sp. TaxID=2026721 RepID=UPI002627E2F1|nr:rhodanese-like domain-containing protein [Candidatus Thioglobus sp.]MDG2395119.1 rhodanese-like domain-containing protein [Candidatus Thioglobus sp.]